MPSCAITTSVASPTRVSDVVIVIVLRNASSDVSNSKTSTTSSPGTSRAKRPW
jgi:hypothetical protein